MPARAFSMVALSVVTLIGSGCKSDKCKERPAEAQVAVELAGVSAVRTDVTVIVNGGTPLLRKFSTPTPSFVFEFDTLDKPPRTLVITASAFDGAGRLVGTGEASTTFTSDGCNFFRVVVRSATAPDGGTDAGPPDGPQRELPVSDGKVDQRRLDLAKDVAKPDQAKPDAPKPDIAQVDLAKLDAKPDAPKPDGPKLDAPKSDVIKPDAKSVDKGVGPMVSTVAGNGTAGYANGSALSSQFNAPYDVAVDTAGNVYVSDPSNRRIRLVANGQVTDFAGTGAAGWVDGAALQATLTDPRGLVLGAAGTLYFVDRNYIRAISSGQVTTLVNGGEGYVDGPGSTAKLCMPSGIAVDAAGKLYIADEYNQRIRLYSGGVVSTLAGSGMIGRLNGMFADGDAINVAQFNHPVGVAVNPSGTVVYVADMMNHRIRKIEAGQVTTVAGSGPIGSVGAFADGPGATARFYNPADVFLGANGKLYIAEYYNRRIRIYESGTVTTLAGQGGLPGYLDGPALQAKFYNPLGVAVDSSGKVYLTDTGDHRVRMVSP